MKFISIVFDVIHENTYITLYYKKTKAEKLLFSKRSMMLFNSQNLAKYKFCEVFIDERLLKMDNSYEMELVERLISGLNTLLNPVHSAKLRGFTRSDVDNLENAVQVLEKIKFKNLLSDNDGYDVLIF